MLKHNLITLIFMAMSLSVSALETTDAIKRDFQELKNETIPKKTAKAKKKISEVTNKLNSKIQKTLND